jgi:hypothetical protein
LAPLMNNNVFFAPIHRTYIHTVLVQSIFQTATAVKQHGNVLEHGDHIAK